MSHGRRNLPLFQYRQLRAFVALTLAASVFGCAGDDGEPDSEGDENARTWSVDSDESRQSTDAAGESDGIESAEDTSVADAGSETDEADATYDTDWPTVRCDAGAATEAAFEGTARNPATRLTFYVRDDCALIGTVATSMPHGNFSLALRGSVDDDGHLTLTGSNRDHQCDIAGAMGSDDADVSLNATFDGVDLQRDMTLQRIN